MSRPDLTPRDHEYLIVIYLLNGHREAVGPAELADRMEVSKEGAFQKMRRLEKSGMGEYVKRKGLLLNEKAVRSVENDILGHHLLERYFQDHLDMKFKEACRESSHLGYSVSQELLDAITEKMDTPLKGDCGLDLEPPFEPEELKGCRWCCSIANIEERGRKA